MDQKILLLTAIETRQERYQTQVTPPFVDEKSKRELEIRLETTFSHDSTVQQRCQIDFGKQKNGKPVFSAKGMCDVLTEDVVYELKFVSELSHENFLQCACYMLALNKEKGILWNTRNNDKYEITIRDRATFRKNVLKTITKGALTDEDLPLDNASSGEKIAVIDTETTYGDQVMSIGIAIAEAKTYELIESHYYILTPECTLGGMYSDVLRKRQYPAEKEDSRKNILAAIRKQLEKNNITTLFAYNAQFDYRHLPELDDFSWYDIMRIAAYREFNDKIPETAECTKTGRLKRDFGVQSMTRMMSGKSTYCEVHNAVCDAIDELHLMQMLALPIEKYAIAEIKKSATSKTAFAETGLFDLHSERNRKSKQNDTGKHSDLSTNQLPYFDLRQVPLTTKQTAEDKKGQVVNPSTDSQEDTKTSYSVEDVAVMLGKSKSYVYNLIHTNRLTAIKIKNKFWIAKEEFDRYIEYKRKIAHYAVVSGVVTWLICSIILVIFALIFSYLN